ncbi:hypothetical protein Ddc_22880 [Ditylenchus destructor]|nr:hypothetical protein Ddc_22880 [Ditylenchus destructor]
MHHVKSSNFYRIILNASRKCPEMSFSGIKQSIAFLAILAISYSTGKFVGLNDLVGLSGTFAQGDGPVVGPNSSLCRSYCRSIVGVWDQYFPDAPPNPTPEAMAEGTRECAKEDPADEKRGLYQPLCAALVELHRELVFAKAYFEHRKNKTVDPCKQNEILIRFCPFEITYKASAAGTRECANGPSGDPCPGCVESDREGGENTNLYQEFCAALVELHRELVFAKAYFEHRKNKTVDPCVVAGIC